MSLDPRDPIALTQALVRCESVTPAEGGALTLLESVLRPAGFTCHRMTFSEPGTPDVENLYARFGAAEPHICFAGHTDVVPPGNLEAWSVPPFAGEIKDGILYGRGTVDMKGGVACFAAAALRHLAASGGKIGGSISFLITGDEEGPSINGTMKVLEWLRERGEVVSDCIVGEPSNPEALGDEIKVGRRGSLTVEIVVHGKQGHAAYPQKAENPLPKLVRILDRLSSAEIDGGTRHFEPSNLQATVISVPNRAANVIPAEARATFNIRYNDTWRRPTIEAWVRDQCAAAAATVDARYDLAFAGTGDVFLTSPGVLVDTLSAAVKAETGRTPALTTGGGTSDARFIKDLCPVVEFGLVNKTIHAVDEHVPVSDLVTLTAIYERFLARYFAGS
ncbi:succinyl-diaminopimelate desuccinylase [Hyphomicrobium sp. DMF-1]|jgi:succinyl-diaminopimelate desuccinylase|uniref:succinyl-diaminopimelate desuccinylase n=1 Tax=Hyphomicrobium sp. DMF-1 TaxID=3019544 RepID=UPI0022EBB452|nr:succinyl-diaminopimelate desuccinylase [Hyphomicrobium sp. DMF-1]WBT38675.1 succinyl-diaminopimelate desuccinylase [Hyphomicrobium sp. DMF-1]